MLFTRLSLLRLLYVILVLPVVFNLLTAFHFTCFVENDVSFFVAGLCFDLNVLEHQLGKLSCAFFLFHTLIDLKQEPIKVLLHSVLNINL